MNDFEYKELDAEGYQTLSVIAEADKFNKWMFETILPHCKGRILEIGSGIGNISGFFIEQKRNIVLSDIRANYCDFLEKKFNLKSEQLLRSMDLTDPDLSSKFGSHFNTFDTVFALNVVEHIKDDELAIANCMRFLKPGGTLVILVPAYNSLYNTFDEELGHYRRYTRKSLTAVFQKAKLKIKQANYFNAVGIIGWLTSGKVQRNKTIPAGQMKLYNKLVPVIKIIDKVLLQRIGLSVIVIGEKV